MKDSDKEIFVLEQKIKLLNDIWVDYFFTYPFFKNKVKFTKEEESNYIGVLFGYLSDSFNIVFSETPIEFNSYIEKFSYQIALLQSIYVQQDLIEELLRVFKTGIERKNLNENINYIINREIRNELVGHPISRNPDFSLRSSTVFGYEKTGNSIQYLKYEFPENKGIVYRKVEINDILNRHKAFLKIYLDLLLSKSYSKLNKFKTEVLEVLNLHLSKTNTDKVINFYEIHFSSKFEQENEISLTELKELSINTSHPRYKYTFKFYFEYINDFYKDSLKSIEDIVTEKHINPISHSNLEESIILPKIHFVNSDNFNDTHTSYKRTDYNYELGKLYTKRNAIDFNHFSETIFVENKDDQSVIQEIEHLRNNLTNKLEYICGWNYLSFLLKNKLSEISCK